MATLSSLFSLSSAAFSIWRGAQTVVEAGGIDIILDALPKVF
ncbi:hypothetical protein [Corynebacterium tapiri]|nr:hypothetical protein [Corynebacterium tapiri]